MTADPGDGPYQSCRSATADSTESAEIDADSVVVELYNTWTVTPGVQASVFSQAEGELARTEFDEGPYRMTRIARLGPLDPEKWGWLGLWFIR